MTRSARTGLILGLILIMSFGVVLFSINQIIEMAKPVLAHPSTEVALRKENEPTLLDCIGTINPHQSAVALRSAIRACKAQVGTGW